MTNTDAHILLNAAKAGANVSERQITLALKATGDLDPIKRKDNVPEEVTHAVPVFVTRERYKMTLPKIVFKPFEVAA